MGAADAGSVTADDAHDLTHTGPVTADGVHDRTTPARGRPVVYVGTRKPGPAP
ncbi:hypothetical protein [Streptomyces yangpuensis]|uniref:hypothetical protein n=1 Tax=Streptomyces yangpuensis TaxID=1648182 RepID=UPI003819BD40